MRRFLNKLLSNHIVKKMKILRDNKINLTLIKVLKNQNCIKYINIINYHIQRIINDKNLEIKQIKSFYILADKFTKAIPTRSFKKY